MRRRFLPKLGRPERREGAAVTPTAGPRPHIGGIRLRIPAPDNAPSRQLCRLDGKPWQCGKDATNALARKIARRPVTCEDLGRDRYKRIIGRCTVAGEDLEKWMVQQGLALAYRRYSLDYVDEEADAQAARHLGWRVREAVGVAPGQAARHGRLRDCPAPDCLSWSKGRGARGRDLWALGVKRMALGRPNGVTQRF